MINGRARAPAGGLVAAAAACSLARLRAAANHCLEPATTCLRLLRVGILICGPPELIPGAALALAAREIRLSGAEVAAGQQQLLLELIEVDVRLPLLLGHNK